MFDANDDAKSGFRRIELLTGPGRRRRWSAEEKSRIVEETLAPGARVSEVARRWDLSPQQVFGWRRAARQDLTATSSMAAEPPKLGFVPIVTDTPTPVTAPRVATAVIEVKLAGAVVRVVSGREDDTQLTAVLRAVRASASKP